jgi:hypothetical protein
MRKGTGEGRRASSGAATREAHPRSSKGTNFKVNYKGGTAKDLTLKFVP